jgi:hypothetical protein
MEVDLLKITGLKDICILTSLDEDKTNIYTIVLDKHCIISSKQKRFAISEYTKDKKSQFYLCEEETKDVVIEVKKAMLKLLPNIKDSDIMVASSNDSEKHSYHIVLDRWCVSNNTEARALFEEICELLPERYRGALDNKMYKSIQQFRMLESHKFGSLRVKTFCEELSTWKPPIKPLDDKHLLVLQLTSFILMNISGCSFLKSFIKEKIDIENKPNSDDEITRDDVNLAIQLFRETFEGHECFTYLSYSKFFITLKRLKPSMCQTCGRIHEAENPYLIVVGKNRAIYYDCRRTEKDINKVYIGSLGPRDNDKVQNNEEREDERENNETKNTESEDEDDKSKNKNSKSEDDDSEDDESEESEDEEEERNISPTNKKKPKLIIENSTIINIKPPISPINAYSPASTLIEKIKDKNKTLIENEKSGVNKIKNIMDLGYQTTQNIYSSKSNKTTSLIMGSFNLMGRTKTTSY